MYWNYMPAPYMVDRFNALAARGNVDFTAWFNARREPNWSGAWSIDESSWLFDHRYLPHFFLGGRSIGFPPGLLGPRAPTVMVSPHGEPSFVAGWFAARARRVRTAFWVVKTFDSWAPRQNYKETLKRYMFPRADAIFVPGEDARQYARTYGASDTRIFTLRHPVDGEFLSYASRFGEAETLRAREELGLRGPTFIYVGRLWWGKGLDNLLSAFAILQDALPQVSLLIVGDGEERASLEKTVRDRNLRNVVFVGFRQKRDLARLYSAADAFVFPTLGDPFGLVVGEAMSCGLPIVSTSAVGEIVDRVQEGRNGFIVPPGDVARLANRMLRLAESPPLVDQMGRESKMMASGRTPERWSAEFEDGIANLLALPPVPGGDRAN